ncbi:MAG: PHP domain-containing protein [Moraxellaceae bacterium]|nr:MAG: PHP domain-containing protein [Moraxellaceae bacterium]
MKFDLHCHSHFSDGILSPEMLVSRAKEKEVDVLALTDHDTIAGLALAHKAAAECGIIIVNGIEFSSQWGKGGVHIVGLGIDVDSTELKNAIHQQHIARVSRAEQIALRLEKGGITGALEGARAIAGNADIGRPHFAQYLINQGVVSNINAAFKKYLGAGKVADVKYQWPDMQTINSWIHAAGGVAVLAHPCKYELTRVKMCALIKDFAAAGGDALEVISGQQSLAVTTDLARIALANNLAASCGSDFHTPSQPWQELGSFSALPQNCRPVWELLGFAA